MEDVYVVEGDSASLRCLVKFSIPKAQIQWKYSDGSQYLTSSKNLKLEIINNNNSLESTETFSQLLIKKTSRQDDRTFTCLAKNKVGDAQKNVKLIVEYKPKFNVLSQDSKEVFFSWALVEGKNSIFLNQKFTCIVEGRPVTKIKWFFNNQPLQGDNHTFLVEEMPNFSRLKVNPKSIHDFGEYKCLVSNVIN